MTASLHARPYPEQLAAARAFIESNDRFLVVAHVNPDGDAASSTLAVGWLLECLDKRYVMINEGKTPDKFGYIWGFDRLLRYDEQQPEERFRFVISVDCADASRIGKVRELFAEDVQVLNIDHHATNDYFGDVHLIREDAAATVEVLYDLAVEMRVPLTLEFGTALYTGLLTDTGGFRYSNTTPKVMKIAAELLAVGVAGHRVAEQVLEKITFSHITVLKRALGTLSFAFDNKVSWITVSQDDIRLTGATSEDMEGLILYPRNIEGVEVGLLFKQTDEQTVKVSFRSNGTADVAAIAKLFGGGGHVRASGCTLVGELQDIVAQVIKEVGQSLQ
ncbi:bifunctional oligoribonuclease/PAP phosphatase NrnA [Paenibacillus hemerocallicola]|uniref:Bifunctional oligoribonuclease/PAP phosphatase NrnA n=1 Tax=Paenibacillus hemerocallicola TaxID=1172614 RepID=A0A5C4TAR7_9BACL|nr:bifunctional oligoribonuclease/PAP phosphatase NrnA [Paenibacillus hemerocallicola]TNJ66153.1 bifunctional oligoribonuclease/PAP phosphatase NrnA [Paenibacillus hemerocallicola]